jgi:hypothetical protein
LIPHGRSSGGFTSKGETDMAHGYLGDGYGTHGEIDPDRDNDRDRHSRDRDRDRERMRSEEWRDYDRDRGALFGERRPFREQESRWSERNERWPQDRWPEQRGRASGYNRQAEDWSGQQRRASADPDDHYRSWRERHMAELDRDYADYCRECEQQFHRDFDSWRNNRQQNASSKRQQGGENDELILAAEDERVEARAQAGQGSTPSAEGAATLGTNNPQNATIGRGGR